ncbi:MAG: hypothetical protein KGL92_14585 [Gammaproteobacteria bacterium]|nr:hypothetical protein [Gammaproteobacteria bacterium]
MIQQINLYERTLRGESDAFSASALIGGFGIVLAGLVAISGFVWWRVAMLDRQLHALQAQAEQRRSLVAKGNLVANSAQAGQALEARLRNMAIALDRRQRALRYLRSGAAGTESGFSARLEALAREQVDGLWLRGVTLSGDSTNFELTGRALHADLVPLYLSKLAAEPALAGTKLQLLEIHAPRSTAGAGVPTAAQARLAAATTVDFTVSSGADHHGRRGPQRASDDRFAMAAATTGPQPR